KISPAAEQTNNNTKSITMFFLLLLEVSFLDKSFFSEVINQISNKKLIIINLLASCFQRVFVISVSFFIYIFN
mgnify:CR=1